MDAVQVKLRRLRNWFIAWFVVEAVAGTVVAARVLEGLRYLPWPSHTGAGASVEVTVGAGILVSAVLLLVALLVFDALIDISGWARIVLLVVGWITVGSSVINVLVLMGPSSLLGSVVGVAGGTWPAIAAISLVTKAGDFVYWAWVIHTLQFNPGVRDAFLRSCSAPGS
jgi:hypothetical protein